MIAIIANRYQIEHELGTGGMGTVYRGVDIQLNQTVAIKQLKAELARPDLIERFQREGEALRDLNHPNIVKMLDMVEQDGLHYLVMEYVAGGDLQQLLKVGPIPIERCVQLALDLSDALTRTHKLNIIHRDLKPANVLIAEDDTLRLTDFGVALIGEKERVTNADAIVGTIDYLPPEVFQDGVLDRRVDIWAFGVMLFEMLSGHRPFSGKTVTQTIYNIVTEPVPELEELRSDAPIALIDLIYRMLEKDSAARIRSIRLVGLELEDLLYGLDVNNNTPPETRFASPVSVSPLRPKHNIPLQATDFVGREVELTELSRLLEDTKIRLITIVAPGGMGKTRLSLETAEQHIEKFNDGVYFVELAPLSDPENIIPAIAEAIGYQFYEDDKRPQKEQILEFLAEKQILFIMDNYEHLLEGASLVSEILTIAPDVQVLATSRERLNLSGEQLFTLSGLEFPEWETPEDALEYAAVKLFMNSAKRSRPNFELLADNLTYLARICRFVAGMPLAIVLAAAWVETLTLEEIAEELTQDIEILETNLRDIPERQRSIQVVFDYAWNRLTDDEQNAFMKMSVFRGGFTRKAGQAVTGASLRQLTNLVNKSLLRRDNNTGRYEIHELLRQFAERQLDSSGEADTARTAHMNYYADALEEREPILKAHKQLEAYYDIESDFENSRVAWNWANQIQDVKAIDRMLDSLMIFARVGSRLQEIEELFAEGVLMLEQLIGKENHYTLGRALLRHAWVLINLYRYADMKILVNQGLEIAREHHNQSDIIFGICLSGVVVGFEHDPDKAVSLLKESLVLCDEQDDKWLTVNVLRYLNYFTYATRRREEAYQYNLQFLALCRELEDKFIIGAALGNMGTYHLMKGQYEEGRRFYQLALANARERRRFPEMYWFLHNLFDVSLEMGEIETARRFYEESTQIPKDELTSYTARTKTHQFATRMAILDANYLKAHQIIQEAVILAEHTANFSGIATVQELLACTLCYIEEFEQAIGILILQLENALKSQNLPRIMHLSEGLAHYLASQKEHNRAAELFGLIDTHPAGFTELYKKYPPILELVDKLKSELGEESFQAAYERGSQLDLETTLQAFLDEYKKDNA